MAQQPIGAGILRRPRTKNLVNFPGTVDVVSLDGGGLNLPYLWNAINFHLRRCFQGPKGCAISNFRSAIAQKCPENAGECHAAR